MANIGRIVGYRVLIAAIVALLLLILADGRGVRFLNGSGITSAQTVPTVTAGGPYIGTTGVPVTMTARFTGATHLSAGTMGAGLNPQRHIDAILYWKAALDAGLR